MTFHVSPRRGRRLGGEIGLDKFHAGRSCVVRDILRRGIITANGPLVLVRFQRGLQEVRHRLREVRGTSSVSKRLLVPVHSVLRVLRNFGRRREALTSVGRLVMPGRRW